MSGKAVFYWGYLVHVRTNPDNLLTFTFSLKQEQVKSASDTDRNKKYFTNQSTNVFYQNFTHLFLTSLTTLSTAEIIQGLRFFNRALWYTYVIRTNKMHNFYINILI
jgi:hypothetical protein